MLPDVFRFRIANDTGQTFDFSGADSIVLTAKYWKYAPAGDGTKVWSNEVTVLTGSGTLLHGGGQAGSEQDNTSDSWDGVILRAAVSTDNAGSSGSIPVQIEWPTNGIGGTYPSASADFDNVLDPVRLGIVPLTGAQTRDRNFRYE